jgi:hypothetical protein
MRGRRGRRVVPQASFEARHIHKFVFQVYAVIVIIMASDG